MADPKIKEFGVVEPLPLTRKKVVVKPGPGQPQEEPEDKPGTYETKVIVPSATLIKSEDGAMTSD